MGTFRLDARTLTRHKALHPVVWHPAVPPDSFEVPGFWLWGADSASDTLRIVKGTGFAGAVFAAVLTPAGDLAGKLDAGGDVLDLPRNELGRVLARRSKCDRS